MNLFQINIFKIVEESSVISYTYSLYEPTQDSTAEGSCSQGIDDHADPTIVYSSSSPLIIGSVLYTNTGLTIPYNGGDFYVRDYDGRTYKIDSSGVVIDKQICSIPPYYTFSLYDKGSNNTCTGDGTFIATVYGATSTQSVSALYTDTTLTTPFDSTGLAGFTHYFMIVMMPDTYNKALKKFTDDNGSVENFLDCSL